MGLTATFLAFLLLLIFIVCSSWLSSEHDKQMRINQQIRSLSYRSEELAKQSRAFPRDGKKKAKKKAKKAKAKAKKPLGAITITPKNDQSCPLCWEAIHSSVWYCDTCKTPYHMDCFEEMGKAGECPTTGCHNRIFEEQHFPEKVSN